MKNSYLILLLALLALLSVGAELTAQDETTTGSGASTTSTTNPSGNAQSSSYTLPSDFVPLGGAPMVKNDFAYNEIIFWFEQAQTPVQQFNFGIKVEDFDGTLVNFTSGGHYALVEVPSFSDACEYLGEGNPLTDELDEQGKRIEIGLNYNLSTHAWAGAFTDQCPTSGDGFDFSGNQPASSCTSSSNIIPPTGKSSVRVAIIDSGVGSSDRFSLNGSSLTSEAIDREGNFVHPGSPSHPHGTYVANIISGIANHQGIQSQLAIQSYKVLNEDLRTNTFAVVAAIEDATFNPNKPRTHIISMSIGFIPLNCGPVAGKAVAAADGDVLNNALEQAKEAGIVIITSAGNRGENLDVFPQYPAAYTGLSNVVTVGALACHQDARMGFSNFSGQHVDLFTTGAYVQSLAGSCFRDVHGTSFATPIVAAKAAMHVTKQGVYDPIEVTCLLRDQTKDFSGVNPGEPAIYGIVDADSSRDLCNVKPPKSNFATNFTKLKTVLEVSPNPFSGPLTVSLPTLDNSSVKMLTIYNSNGKVVLRRESRQAKEKLDLSNLIPGVYWLNVQSGNSNTTKPIIKR